MGFYERRILPTLLDLGMRNETVQMQREKVVPLAQGRVLEVGIGSGLNLRYYDPAKVERVIGLDPSAELRRLAERRAAKVPIPVEFIGLEAEDIPLPAQSIDTVLVTYTLCTIPDVARALAGMRRVLKPEGRLIFSEHGQAPDPGVRKWQDRLDPFWGRLFGGCHLNRAVPQILSDAGFSIDALEMAYLKGVPRLAGYNYWGTAVCAHA